MPIPPPVPGTGLQQFSLSGPLTVFAVRSERDRMLSVLSEARPLCVDLAGVTECDAAGLQLLCSLRRSYEARGLELRFLGATSVVLPCAVALGLEASLFQG